ncbi:hypothetical protein HGRIS_005457 [Hohenbuehelia grisea]|uniref:Uncharacterized protein n=1 Tax=Hohenbuehelia grisea TaxID=104357 RepID=A0ABR3JYZ2_9AGAR
MKASTTTLPLFTCLIFNLPVLGQLVNPQLSFNTTVEIAGTDPQNPVLNDTATLGTVSGSVLTRDCLLLTRQKGQWKRDPNGSKSSINFGDYEGTGADTAANFKDFGIPTGVLVNPILDVSSSGDIDLDIWFTHDPQSPCVALYDCFDVRHMPQGCGTWPASAIWETKEEGWPKGETNIIEGVKNEGPKRAVLHTTSNCTMPAERSTLNDWHNAPEPLSWEYERERWMWCQHRTERRSTRMEADERTKQHFKVWFWSRNDSSVPAEVKNGAGTVNPDKWGTPFAYLPNT